jgi:hypothetical protein
MDMKSQKLMNYLSDSLLHPDVSGFEILEVLDVRSQLAYREPLLEDAARGRLEKLDRQMSRFSNLWSARIAEVADLAEMRKRNHVLPSHWWWYMDEFSSTAEATG